MASNDGIRVLRQTSLTRALFDDDDFDRTSTDSIPLKRWGEVGDIASRPTFTAT